MHTIRHLKEVDSTNSYALRNLDVLQDREVVIADIQSEGHGRFARPWLSNAPGNLYMSIVLKPSGKTDTLNGLTLYMAVTLCEVFSEYGVETALKWPNDVLVREEKIAGILAETRFQENVLLGYVLGTGINLNMTSEELSQIDQPATSLNLIIGSHVNREGFANRLLERFFSRYSNYIVTGFPLVRDEYLRKCALIGKKITLSLPGQVCAVTARSLTSDGELVVERDDGEHMIVYAGDILSVDSL